MEGCSLVLRGGCGTCRVTFPEIIVKSDLSPFLGYNSVNSLQNMQQE